MKGLLKTNTNKNLISYMSEDTVANQIVNVYILDTDKASLNEFRKEYKKLKLKRLFDVKTFSREEQLFHRIKKVLKSLSLEHSTTR